MLAMIYRSEDVHAYLLFFGGCAVCYTLLCLNIGRKRRKAVRADHRRCVRFPR